MVLAIEADGASYPSSATARDRDRLRQEQLERLGWTFHRIWSTDWFTDADTCVAKACVAYDRAVTAADHNSANHSARIPQRDSGPETGARVGVAPGTETRRRGSRPAVQPGMPITAYSMPQLVAVIRWIESDTLLRTEDQLFEAFMDELGFQRRGSRIQAAFDQALPFAHQNSRNP